MAPSDRLDVCTPLGENDELVLDEVRARGAALHASEPAWRGILLDRRNRRASAAGYARVHGERGRWQPLASRPGVFTRLRVHDVDWERERSGSAMNVRHGDAHVVVTGVARVKRCGLTAGARRQGGRAQADELPRVVE
jgi:hypothetical protein